MSKIGIRHEDKYLLEKRVAITPSHVKRLIKESGIEVYVQSSAKRIFTDKEYEEAGAVIVEEFPDDVKTIFGVKEMPVDFFREGDSVVFFSHTIKGQAYNMPMLRRMKDMKVNLMEYERITDENGKRIIFFGRFAGLAGAINTLWSLGERLDRKGVKNPFSILKQAHKYSSLDEAKNAVRIVGEDIRKNGLAEPLTIGITGYGNVSRGAQEIIDILPVKEISADELVDFDFDKADKRLVYKAIFKESDISEPIDENYKFELQDYYDHPEKYKNKFERYVPNLTVLMNCMYWTPKYPRIITKDYLAKHFSTGKARLEVIGDVTCDPDGSIECTHMGTLIQDPVFVYDPIIREPTMGFDGDGVLVMAVDILPSELPKDSSMAFGDALFPFVAPIANCDFSQPFSKLELPEEIKRALILHRGKLTPDYQYINKFLKSKTH